MVMEYVDGCTLEELINKKSLIEDKEVLLLSSQIFNGIRSLRSIGITHRDLNLRNIKLNSERIIKFLDFGIATDEANPLAKDARRYGFPEGEVADDYFSLGLITYQLATREHILLDREPEIRSNTFAENIKELKLNLLNDNGRLKEEYLCKIPGYLKGLVTICLEKNENKKELLENYYLNLDSRKEKLEQLLGTGIDNEKYKQILKLLI